MSQYQDLVRFLSDTAQDAAQVGDHHEAEELLTLRARIVARQFNASQLQLPLDMREAA